MTETRDEIPVLDKGFVRLDDSMADDLSVVNSARVSFAKRSEYERLCEHPYHPPHGPGCFPWTEVLNAADTGLINFLLEGKHGTPFEHNSFRFHVKLPIFVAREFMRHRIGSFNEWSARYSKLEAEFYIPDNVRSQVGKPGAYEFVEIDDLGKRIFIEQLEFTYDVAWTNYERALENGVAKELARLLLPVSVYTQFYWTVNARSLMNFISLRNAETAQYEIREYAKVIESIFAGLMPVTHQAFVANGRVAP